MKTVFIGICLSMYSCLSFCQEAPIKFLPGYNQNPTKKYIDGISKIDLLKTLKKNGDSNKTYLYEGAEKQTLFEDITSGVLTGRGMVTGTVLKRIDVVYNKNANELRLGNANELKTILESNKIELIQSDKFVAIVDNDLAYSKNWPLNKNIGDDAKSFLKGATFKQLIELLVSRYDLNEGDFSTSSAGLNNKVVFRSGEITDRTTVREIYIKLIKITNETRVEPFSYHIDYLNSSRKSWGVSDVF